MRIASYGCNRSSADTRREMIAQYQVNRPRRAFGRRDKDIEIMLGPSLMMVMLICSNAMSWLK